MESLGSQACEGLHIYRGYMDGFYVHAVSFCGIVMKSMNLHPAINRRLKTR